MLYSVTGATGLLGNNLVRLLLKEGHRVRVAVRDTSDGKPLHGLDVEIVSGDLNDPGFAAQLLQQADGLFHCAAFIWFGLSKLEKSMQINMQASQVLACQCARQQVRMLFVSSVDALAAGSPDQPADEKSLEPAKGAASYVVSKRAAERVLLKMQTTEGLDVVIVNPGLLIGPYDWKPSTGQMILAVTDGFIPLTPSGGISVADVRNVAAAMLGAMQRGRSGERYILAGKNLPYLELWRKMASLVGRSGPLSNMNRRMERVVGRAGDLFTRATGRELQVNSQAIALGSRWNYYSSQKAIDELSYEPGSISIALDDAWDWLVANGYSKKHSPK